jgi:uncharacterized membrane protein YkvA (DUF1232 family)
MTTIVRFDVTDVSYRELQAAHELRPPRLRRRAVAAERRRGQALVAQLARELSCFAKLLYRLARDPRISRLDKLLLLSALAYVVAPRDLIPDRIPVLGQLDDVLVAMLVLRRLFRHAGIDLLLEHWEGDPATLEALLELVDRGAVLPAPGVYPRPFH